MPFFGLASSNELFKEWKVDIFELDVLLASVYVLLGVFSIYFIVIIVWNNWLSIELSIRNFFSFIIDKRISIF